MDRLASEILQEFQSAMDELIERGLLIDTNSLIPFEAQDRTTLSWSRESRLSYLFGDYPTIDHYRSILERRDFVLCFQDGGLIQIYYEIENGEITKHRLCFFPCPFRFTFEDRQDISLADIPLLFNEVELRQRIKLNSPIRFEYDAELSDDQHAHSHFSLNKETFRMPAYGPISLGHFFRFVLRYFYETEFSGVSTWTELRPRLYSRTLRYPPPHELHLDTASTY